MENQFGRTSLCTLRAGEKEGKTVLEQVSFTAPFKIMSPFYESGDFMHVMLLSASAGIMEGDTQEFDIEVKEGGRLRFSAQAYEKIHKMTQGSARRNARIRVAHGGIMDYGSQPVIPFAQSAFRSTLEAELEDESSLFLYQEVLSCGRAARGEKFEYRFYHNLVHVRRQGKLIYRDNCFFEPKTMDLPGLGMYEGFSHMGSFLVFGTENTSEKVEKIRELLEEDEKTQGGVTRISDMDLAVRILGNGAQHMEDLFAQIRKIIDI